MFNFYHNIKSSSNERPKINQIKAGQLGRNQHLAGSEQNQHWQIRQGKQIGHREIQKNYHTHPRRLPTRNPRESPQLETHRHRSLQQ